MNEACHRFGLTIEEYSSSTKLDLKKRYHRLALACHPDKTHPGMTSNFQELNAAYETLVTLKEDQEEEEREREKEEKVENTSDYISFFTQLFHFIGGESHLYRLLFDVIMCEKFHEESSRDDILWIYNFIENNKTCFFNSGTLLAGVATFLQEKFKTIIVTLRPTAEDMLKYNVIEVVLGDDSVYYIPSWQRKDQHIEDMGISHIVRIRPFLAHNIRIDHDNNVIIRHSCNFPLLSELHGGVTLACWKDMFIPFEELQLKHFQRIIFPWRGIPKVCVSDIYNVTEISNLIVEFTFN